jgi:hypothetical protein
VRDSGFPPGFAASLVGAAAGFVGGALLTAVLAAPFALASASTLAIGAAPDDDFARRLLIVFVLLLTLQLLVGAWIAQQAASLLGDGAVRFWRAVGALFIGGLATLVAALALPAEAALPVVGHSWVGILVAAWVISSGPRTVQAR